MKETGIIMSGNHPKLVQDGTKTQTRRVINNPTPYQSLIPFGDKWLWNGDKKNLCIQQDEWVKFCPYGQVGDRLWVRETHYRCGQWRLTGDLTKTGKPAWKFTSHSDTVFYSDSPPSWVTTDKRLVGWWKRPSMFMPRWASRITLEITEVRVERVQEIDIEDIKKEGIEYPFNPNNFPYLNPQEIWNKEMHDGFGELWDSLNAKRGYGWEVNLWVWVISFKKE